MRNTSGDFGHRVSPSSRRDRDIIMKLGPRLAIRADASHEGGIGHIMRTLAVAQEWIIRGGRCLYLTCAIPEKLNQRLIDEGCEIIDLGEKEDLFATGRILSELRPHWLLIDGYHLDASYQAGLPIPERTKTAVISDFGSKDWHQPTCVVHANLVPLADHSGLPTGAHLLTGPPYILIRKELLREDTDMTSSQTAKRILILMGGSDPFEAADFIVRKLDLESASCRIVLGPAYPENGKLRSLDHPAIELIDRPPSLAPHYSWADTGITTPSTTSLEMAHHGLPMGLVTIADNQYHIRDAFVDLQAALPLADLTSSETSIDTNALELLLNSQETRTKLSLTSHQLVDGQGSSRICDTLELPSIRFREVTLEDARILWEWTNDSATRKQSFSSEPVPWDDHLEWLSRSLENSKQTMFMVHDDRENRLGQLRFDEDDGGFVISFSLAPQARGLGLAPLIVDRACSLHLNKFPGKSIIAWIKTSNMASLRTFHLANFVEDPIQSESDRVKLRR